MKRRHFIANSLLATGGVMIGTNILYAEALKEVNQQFLTNTHFNSYDLIINGAGLAGYFAAIEASKRGLHVLILDKRTSPGYDIAGKRKLWINSNGIEGFTKDHFELFFPPGEIDEIYTGYSNPVISPNYSLSDNELLLFAGSIKKGLLRNLLINNVHVMLMTDVCGIISDNISVNGVLVANKQGLYTINCNSYLDATENNLFSRELLNQKYKIIKAGFVLELIDVENPKKKVTSVNESYGVLNNSIVLHKGKMSKDQQFIEFEFPVEGNDLSVIEQKARFISAQLSKNLPEIDPAFSKAKLKTYALECSYFIENEVIPQPSIKGYYQMPNPNLHLGCSIILNIESATKSLIENIKVTKGNQNKKTTIEYIGGTISFDKIDEKNYVNENGITLPLIPFIPDRNMYFQQEKCHVLVAGGGTAGATAALGAAEKGSDTIVAEYFNDLGGTKTMGGVGGYYHGVRDHVFIKEIDKGISQVSDEYNMSGTTGRRFFLLKALKDLGCKIISGVILCGVITKKNKLTGVIISENGRLKTIISDITIDSTGDADIAFFAGVKYKHGNSRTGITQNYSQWDVYSTKGNITRDYDIIDNTKISELQRGLFLSHYESHFYDFHPMLTVRESRMPKGIYTLNLQDVLEEVHFEDFIARARSDFDPHYIGSSEYSRCGFLLPHTNTSIVKIPFRSIVPESIDGLLLSGKGISQTNNAMQFTRMSSDITVLGYVTGQIAAELSSNNIQPRDYKVSSLQKEWIIKGFLPVNSMDRRVETIQEKVAKLIQGEKGYLLKCCLFPKQKVLPVLLKNYETNNNIHLAKALAWFSNSKGVPEIIKELNELFIEELEVLSKDGFIEIGAINYKPESLYWKINQDIALLAMSGDKKSNEIILKILNSTTSGGKVVTYLKDNLYNSDRIDLRLIPFHNRITNLCFYIERLPDSIFIAGLEKLLTDRNIRGNKTTEYDKTRWRVYGADLELYIASSLARCGSSTGMELLIDFLDEIHSNFREFAHRELTNILNQNFGYEKSEWRNYINNKIAFPHKPVGLIKEIEL